MLTIGFFFITFGIFFLFVLLLTIFGYFFQYHLFARFKSKKISLILLLESFGIGTVLFVFYSYFIIDLFRSFNLFTIYLPLVIFDVINIIYVLCIFKFKSKGNLNDILTKIRDFLSDRKVKRHISFLIIAFLLSLLMQGVIETNLSLPETDTYIWFNSVAYLCKYGDLNYDNFIAYGVGFVIFCSGALLITGDLYVYYFFIKYIPIFLFFIVILAVYRLASRIFKKDLEILATLMILLSFNSLMYRFLLGAPSILATTLGVIFFVTLLEKNNFRSFLNKGILLGGMFLVHIIYFTIFFAFLLCFELLILLFTLKKNLKIKEHKFLTIIYGFVKRNGFLILIIGILSIPYFLNLLLNGKFFFDFIYHYSERGFDPDIPSQISRSLNSEIVIFKLAPSRTDPFYNLIFIGFDIPVNKTLGWAVIFIVIGLLFNKKWNKTNQNQMNYLIDFIKFTFIFMFLMFLINSLLFVINNHTILSIASFINQYGKRVFELLSPVWSIVFVMGVRKIFKIIKKFKTKKISNFGKEQKKYIKELKKSIDKIYLIVLIVLSASIYSSRLYNQYNIYYSTHYEDDYLVEAVMFISEYFNSEDIEDVDLIVPENVDNDIIYELIYQKDIDKHDFEYDCTLSTELMTAIEEDHVEYVLVDKGETKSSTLDYIDENHDILYENHHYLVFEVEDII